MTHSHGSASSGLPVFVVTIILFAPIIPITMTEDRQEFCHNERFTAECGDSEVVLMTLAQYGRMALGRCVLKDYGYIGCGTDVIGIAHAYCSGRRTCEIIVPNAVLDSLQQPCPGDFKSYLKATYRCQQVISVDAHECSSSTVELTDPVGLIPSVASQETPCGSYKAPWLLRAPPGKTIHITLLDYSVVSLDSTDNVPSDALCVAYASIRERGLRTPFTLCGGRELEKVVYRSQSNVVEVIVQGTQNRAQRHFILKYSFQGCADLASPRHGWAARRGDTTDVGCDGTDVAWSLTCQESAWVGEIGNCTDGNVDGQWSGFSLTLSISIAVVAVIALCIAACILLAGVVFIKRRHRHNSPKTPDMPDVDHEQIMSHEDNYRKAFYGGFPPKPEDPRMPRGHNGENVYAAIQEHMSAGCSLPAGAEDASRAPCHSTPFTYYEPPRCVPPPQHSTKRKCSGTINAIPDPNSGELREYFVLDKQSI